MHRKQAILAAALLAAASGAVCRAQTGPAQPSASSASRTRAAAGDEPLFDIGVSGYQAFTHGTTGDGTQQTAKNAAGGMLELRYLAKPLVGFEFTFSFNPADQTFTPTTGNCGYQCQNPFTSLSAKASEIGVDYVLAKRFGALRPFAVGGLGFFITAPGNSVYADNTVVRPVYIFGGGVDWGFAQRLGVRLQFRDNLYKAPDLSDLYNSTGQYTQSAEPMAGFYYKY